MDIRYKYKQILENLFVSKEGLQLYTINRRFNITPSRLVDFINEFSASGVIRVDDATTVTLTDKGRGNFLKIIPDLFKDTDFLNESYLKKKLLKPMEKYYPYIPSEIIGARSLHPTTEEDLILYDMPF